MAEIPADWDELSGGELLSAAVLDVLKEVSDTEFSCVVHPAYVCTEYRMKLNIFTFGKLRLRIPFTVIAPPMSVDQRGYTGDLPALVEDYKGRGDLFLMLNLEDRPESISGIALARTLSSCIFENRFDSLEDYFSSLRSGYRRRLLKALGKGRSLAVKKIRNSDFDDSLHRLYLNVLRRSKYPLETLGKDFFRAFDGEIFVFYEEKKPLAFVALREAGGHMDFVFGGMDYEKRDHCDLYYNMLLQILRVGIERKVTTINFGQTAEASKQRIGCRLSQRYMMAFSGNRVLNRLLIWSAPLLGYSQPGEAYRCLKTK